MKMDKWLLACAIAMLSIACSDNEEEIIQPTPAPAEIRVLTFEDADYKGGDNLVGERNWSSLVDLEYEGPLLYPTDNTLYRWADDNNTFLASEFPNNYGDYKFWGGGEALSHYTLTDYTQSTFQQQLSLACIHPDTGFGGHEGSRNFCVHNGFVNGNTASGLRFSDGKARIVDHLWVVNTAYVLNNALIGDNFNPAFGDEDFLKIVATGCAADGRTATAEFTLIEGRKAVTEWTRWDLSQLGAVVKIEFDMQGSKNNEYGLSTPAYFAYDDIAVRF